MEFYFNLEISKGNIHKDKNLPCRFLVVFGLFHSQKKPGKLATKQNMFDF